MKAKSFDLAPNWADLLTLPETEGIIKHWQSCVVYWSDVMHPHGLFDVPVATETAARYLENAKTKVVMWSGILAAKQRGEKVQHIIHQNRRSM